MDPEFYHTHPEYDMRSEYSLQSGSTCPGSSKNYRRDHRNKQPQFVLSGASPQEIEEYEADVLPQRQKRSPEQDHKITHKDEDDDDEDEETLSSPIKGFDSFMMY